MVVSLIVVVLTRPGGASNFDVSEAKCRENLMKLLLEFFSMLPESCLTYFDI